VAIVSISDGTTEDAGERAAPIPGAIIDDVELKLAQASADGDTQALWADIRAAFDLGGPGAVRAVIDSRVRQSRVAVEKDLKETRSVTKSATPKKKAPAQKAATRTGRAAR